MKVTIAPGYPLENDFRDDLLQSFFKEVILFALRLNNQLIFKLIDVQNNYMSLIYRE